MANINTRYSDLVWEPVRYDKGSVDLYEEMERRLILRTHATCDRGIRVEVMARSLDDPLWWFDNFAVATDPRHSMGAIPFVPLDAQRDLPRYFLALDGYRNDNDRPWNQALCKSRWQGASWLSTGTGVYGLLFIPHSRWGYLTRSGTELDSLTTGTLLGKVAFQLQSLPAWMVPFISRSRVDHEFVNHDNHASIKGSKTVIDAFRGDRHTATFVDEAASIQLLDVMSASLNNVTDCLVLVSTPKGKGGLFADVCLGNGFETHTPGESGLGWMIHRLHYSQRPETDPETPEGRKWRDAKQAECTPEEWAQEFEIDFETSQPNRILPEFTVTTHAYAEDEHESVLRWIRYHCPVKPQLLETWDFGEGASQTSVAWSYYVPPFELNKRVEGDFLYFFDYATWLATAYDEVLADVAGKGFYTNDNPRGVRPDRRVGDAYGKRPGADQESWFSFFAEDGVHLEPRSLSRRLKRALMYMRVKARDKKILVSPACLQKFNTPRIIHQ